MIRPVLIFICCLAFAGPALAQNPTRADVERYRAQVNQVRPGLGDDKGLPLGTPFNLPPGVSLAGPIAGVGEDESCGEKHGSGPYVSVCLSLCNATGRVMHVDLPKGLVMVSKSAAPFQNGFLVERVLIEEPPTPCGGGGGIPLDASEAEVEQQVAPTANAFKVQLNLYCLNDSKMPSESGTPYALGPVTSDPDLLGLLERIGDAKLDEDGMDAVQTAIYSITEGKGLNWNDERALEAL